jgi:hypothetical protein
MFLHCDGWKQYSPNQTDSRTFDREVESSIYKATSRLDLESNHVISDSSGTSLKCIFADSSK